MMRGSEQFTRGTTVALAVLLVATTAHARSEVIQWAHEEPSDIVGFRVYTSPDAGEYGTAIEDVPVEQAGIDSEGIYSRTIPVADSHDVYVVVTAYDRDDVESIYSNEGMFSMPVVLDDDGDGVDNANDAFPDDPTEWTDSDDDGVGDNADFFPDDPDRHAIALSPYRVNVGSKQAYLDPQGRTWTRDSGFFLPRNARRNTRTVEVEETDFDPLYQSSRALAKNNDTLSFSFPIVANTDYSVRLHFIETHVAPGERLFDIDIEGVTMESDFDIRAAAGAINRALVLEYTVGATDNELDIGLRRGPTASGPILMGIEVQNLYADEAETLTAPSQPYIVDMN
jgi:hypothetical protein